jgi:hypothetical protein
MGDIPSMDTELLSRLCGIRMIRWCSDMPLRGMGGEPLAIRPYGRGTLFNRIPY